MSIRHGLKAPLFLTIFLVVSVRCLRAEDEEYGICSIPCCTVEPSCSQALTVTCHCPDKRRVSLRSRDLPKTVEKVRVRNSTAVDIQNDAFFFLPSVREVEFIEIGRLQLRRNALRLQKNSNLQMVNMTNIKSVDMHHSAVSGYWDPVASITIRNVGMLTFRRNAFNYSSSLMGPDLLPEGIKRFDLAPSALSAPLRRLTMIATHMDACHAQSFPANIHELSLTMVKIDQVHQNCMAVSGALNIHSCQFEDVHSQGISGKVKNIEIRNSNFTKVHKKGMHLQVTHLEIFGSHFGTLMPGALDVQAESSVVVDSVTIKSLHKHALKDIRVTGNTSGYGSPAFLISALDIKDAEYGSLALSTPSSVYVDGLEVHSSSNPTCSPGELARWLLGKASDDDFTTADEQIRQQIENRPLCLAPTHARGVITNESSVTEEKMPQGTHDRDSAHGPDEGNPISGDNKIISISSELDRAGTPKPANEGKAETPTGESTSPPEHDESPSRTSDQDIFRNTPKVEIFSETSVTHTHGSDTEAEDSNISSDQQGEATRGTSGSGGTRLQNRWVATAMVVTLVMEMG